MRKITGFFLLVLLCITGCKKQTPATIEVDDKLKKEINEKNNILEQLYAEGKIDSAATYFTADLIQMPPNAKPILGREAYIEEWKKSVAIGKWIFNLEAKEVRRSGPMAVELGTYTLEFQPNNNAPMPGFKDRGSYVVLWEKHDDEWKIVWDAPVSEIPLAGNAP